MRISAAVSRPQSPSPRIEQVEIEAPRAGELRVRIVAAGICQTDLHAHSGRLSPLPIVLGHEGAGVVEEVGDGVRDFAPGDAVLLSMLIRYWQQGRFPFDRLVRFYPFAEIGKAFSDITSGDVIKPVLRMS
jgi:Zn-dependent alcohol dehydrogenase